MNSSEGDGHDGPPVKQEPLDQPKRHDLPAVDPLPANSPSLVPSPPAQLNGGHTPPIHDPAPAEPQNPEDSGRPERPTEQQSSRQSSPKLPPQSAMSGEPLAPSAEAHVPDQPGAELLQPHGGMEQGANFSNAALDMFRQHGMPQNISLMMALAHISASQISPPPTVAPAQVSLPNPIHESGDSLATGNGHHHGAASAIGGGPDLESFARIEFADSVFQMTTYAVIIGRDQRALEQARIDERRAQEYQQRVDENAALGLPQPSPPAYDRGKFSKSYVSEEGGMLGPESDGDGNPRPAKRRKTSTGGSVSHISPQGELATDEQQPIQEKNPNLISNRQYVSHTPGAAAVDLASLRPSPYHIPFIGIHSPGPNIASRTKAISREHLKIQFNQEKGVFEAIPLHKNGFFCDDVHYRDERVVLKSGDRLQIKDVDFVFVINGVQPGKTGAEEYFDEEETTSRRYSEGGKEMSFEFESSHGGEIRDTSEEEESVADREESQEASDEGEEGEGAHEEDEVMETIENDAEASKVKSEEPEPEALPPPPPKKRGPGRPPKNGIRSKREERLLKKQAQELAKKTLPQPPPPVEPPVKRKVGRPRKHPLPENAPDKGEKRKYKPRKPKNPDGGEGSDGEKAVKEKRREKPKTPPLELKMEEFTEEQLQKPNKNYGVLIDEVLAEAPPEGLTLKQIYKRIQKRYPYYYFVVDTKGWESSVRHNLIGNDAFKKNEETHLWCRVPGIELDAGKKRKAPSPDHAAGSLHGASQHYLPHVPHQPTVYHHGAQAYPPGTLLPRGYQPANGLSYPQQAPAANIGAATAGPGPQQPARQPYPMPPQAPKPAQQPGYGTPGAPQPQQAGVPLMSYNSPYASTAAPRPSAPSSSATPNPNTSSGPHQPAAAQQPRPGAMSGQPSGNAPSAALQPGAVATHIQAVNSNGATEAPLKPAIDPEAMSYISNFKNQVLEQLEKRTPKAEIVALSVINRGIGLTTQSMVPELDSMEKIVLGIFQQSAKARFPAPASANTTAAASGSNGAPAPQDQVQILHPVLLQGLLRFKAAMVETLKPRLGDLKAEALLLSAMDRVLGLADRSTAQPADEAQRREFDGAEAVLMPHIRAKVAECQRAMASSGRQ